MIENEPVADRAPRDLPSRNAKPALDLVAVSEGIDVGVGIKDVGEDVEPFGVRPDLRAS